MNSEANLEIDTIQWLRALPKAELHLHLEGTILPSTLLTLSSLPHHADHPLTASEVDTMYEYTSFAHFLDTFATACDYIRTKTDYFLVVREMIKHLATQGILYAEVYIAFGNIYTFKPDLWAEIGELMTGIDSVATNAEREFGVRVAWIIDITRQRGAIDGAVIVQKAIELRHDLGLRRIIGIGIGGNERAGPCHWFKDLYRSARKAGLHCVAHAGEDGGEHHDGAHQMWEALDIGAERIGHGVAAITDSKLMEELRRCQVALEVSVTSNLCTGVVTSLQDHPLRSFIEAGLNVVLNSDDPAMFHSNLLREYTIVQNDLGLSFEGIKALARNSFAASFLSNDEKSRYLHMLDGYDAPVAKPSV